MTVHFTLWYYSEDRKCNLGGKMGTFAVLLLEVWRSADVVGNAKLYSLLSVFVTDVPILSSWLKILGLNARLDIFSLCKSRTSPLSPLCMFVYVRSRFFVCVRIVRVVWSVCGWDREREREKERERARTPRLQLRKPACANAPHFLTNFIFTRLRFIPIYTISFMLLLILWKLLKDCYRLLFK